MPPAATDKAATGGHDASDSRGFVGDALGLPTLSDEQLAWAVDAAEAAGPPSQLTISVGPRAIAEGTPAMEMHASDAQSVDHIFDWGPVLIGIYLDALNH